MWDSATIMMLVKETGTTLFITLSSTLFAYILGLPMGILLVITAKDGLRPNAVVYKILDVAVNVVRSVPFLILLMLLIPFTRFIVGKSYGAAATIALGTILGYSAMAGVVGGGGLGDVAIRYGYYRYQADIMIVTVVLLVILVQILQVIGTKLSKKLDKRITG